LLEQPSQELLIRRPAVEVPAAPQQQGLLQRPLELVVALLGVAVLVGLARLDGLALETVVPQQGLVSLGERRPFSAWRHGGRQPVGAVELGHAAQLEQGVLKPLAQALETLGEADRAGLPVRVCQHEVVDQVVKQQTIDGHPQFGAVREVTGPEASRMMDLGEEDLLGVAVQRPPGFDPPLQGAKLTVGETAGEAALQVGEQGFGLQAGVELEHDFELRPDIDEGVRSRSPVAVHAFDLRRQPPEAAILARRLGAHAGLGGGQFLGQSVPVEMMQSADLVIRNHREPP
jgi:hypothetical protein